MLKLNEKNKKLKKTKKYSIIWEKGKTPKRVILEWSLKYVKNAKKKEQYKLEDL